MASTINAKNTSTGIVITPDASGQLELQTADTTRMTIDVNGNVGIGTTSPSFPLDVNKAGGGAIRGGHGFNWYNSDNTNNYYIYNAGATGSSNANLLFVQGGVAERMRIDSSGNVIITDTTNSSLSAVGCYNETTGSGANMVIASNGFIIRSTSSLKYKQNVKDATHGLADVLKLRPVTYESKKESESGITYGGLIAEEVHDAGLTEFVQYADDGTPDALSYGHMVSLAFKAIQELKAELDTVKAELATLKGTA